MIRKDCACGYSSSITIPQTWRLIPLEISSPGITKVQAKFSLPCYYLRRLTRCISTRRLAILSITCCQPGKSLTGIEARNEVTITMSGDAPNNILKLIIAWTEINWQRADTVVRDKGASVCADRTNRCDAMHKWRTFLSAWQQVIVQKFIGV